MKTVENSKGNLVVVSRSGELIVNDTNGRERERYKLPMVQSFQSERKMRLRLDKLLLIGGPHTHPIVSEVAGKVSFEAMDEGITVREQTDEITGLSSISVNLPG
ncbi:MAG: hypothetical protein Ct9H90mP27_2720 [Gammaproteobacteria bacterium]|nr:MAG: hypothetical protein Ct9H90mP27_2720 [Gammaproteobacteria bacterium]